MSGANERIDTDLSHSSNIYHRWNRSGFLTTGTGTGLNKSDWTEPAGLPV